MPERRKNLRLGFDNYLVGLWGQNIITNLRSRRRIDLAILAFIRDAIVELRSSNWTVLPPSQSSYPSVTTDGPEAAATKATPPLAGTGSHKGVLGSRSATVAFFDD